MKNETIRKAFENEIDFLLDLTAYEHDLVPFETPDEALTTLAQWIDDGIEVPDRLVSDGPLFVLWNLFVVPASAS